MHWELLVPVVVLAVWVLSHLFRSAEELKERRVEPGQPAPPEAPRSEVEKFLDEINRMRRQPAAPRPAPPPTAMKDIPEVIPVEPPRPAPPPQIRPLPRPPAVRAANPTTLQPPRPPQAKQVKTRRVEPPRPVVAPPALTLATPDAAPAVVSFQHAPSPAVTQMLGMLRNPASVRAAVLLQEVLGPPRCRRR